MRSIAKPEDGEFAPYASMYIDLVPDDGQVLAHMRDNFESVKSLVLDLSADQLLYRYAPEKWTIKQILEHIVDDERIYSYRALRFARNDASPLPGFDQDAYVRHSQANGRDIGNLLAEYEAIRCSTIAMFNGFETPALTRKGTADGTTMSVRAIVHHIAGHELHHLNVIKERYLKHPLGGELQ